MSRVSVDTDGFEIRAVYRCDRCGWETSQARMNARGKPMRIRPIRPIPRMGPIGHECEACVTGGDDGQARRIHASRA